ncbi:MAG: hypothetical protein ABSA66_02655 [Roseiarcus sp.]|jgi:hypothetical protein
MIDSQSAAWKLRRFAHFAAAAAVLLAISPAAKAQGLFSFFGGGASPYEIERRLDAGGYTLTGPLVRRGDVYLADVAAGRGDFERLVIDAETGRIMQRFRARPAGWRDAAPRDWDQDGPDGWDAAPRPPAGIDRPAPRETLDLPSARSEPPASIRQQLARGDDAAKPNVILAPSVARATSSDVTKKPKPSDAKRKVVAPAQAAKSADSPAPPPAQGAQSAAAPPPIAVAVTPPAANAAPPANPPPSLAAKADVAPAQAAPMPAPSVAATAKADAGAGVVATKSPPPAETPDAREPTKSKAVNDLPVTPLD